jgi:hypothetical protein
MSDGERCDEEVTGSGFGSNLRHVQERACLAVDVEEGAMRVQQSARDERATASSSCGEREPLHVVVPATSTNHAWLRLSAGAKSLVLLAASHFWAVVQRSVESGRTRA